MHKQQRELSSLLLHLPLITLLKETLPMTAPPVNLAALKLRMRAVSIQFDKSVERNNEGNLQRRRVIRSVL